MSPLSSLIDELRRRRVFRVAAFYGGIAFVIVQIIDGTFDLMGVPQWVGRVMVTLLALGFPVSMILAWVFDITPEGIVRTDKVKSDGDYPQVNRKSQPLIGNRALGLIAVLAIAFGIWGRWGGDGSLLVSTLRGGNPIPIAVIDFTNETGEEALGSLSGMFITSLEQSRNLAVMTRSGLVDALKRLGHQDVNHIDENLGKQVAIESNLDVLLIASVAKLGEIYSIDLKAFSPEEDRYIFTARENGRGQESLFASLDNLAKRTRTELKERAASVENSSRPVADITTKNLEAYRHYFDAEKLYFDWSFVEMVEQLNISLEADSTLGLAHLLMARYHSFQAQTDELRTRLKVLKNYAGSLPDREKYLYRSLLALSANSYDIKDGITILESANERFPGNKDLMYELGDLLYHSGELERANMFLERVLLLDPTSELALAHFYWSASRSLSPEDALITILRYPYVPSALSIYGLSGMVDAFIAADQPEAGQDYLDSLAAENPNSIVIQYSNFQLQLFKGDIISAERQSASLTHPVDLAYSKIELSTYHGKYRDAIHELNRLSVGNLEHLETVWPNETFRHRAAELGFRGWANLSRWYEITSDLNINIGETGNWPVHSFPSFISFLADTLGRIEDQSYDLSEMVQEYRRDANQIFTIRQRAFLHAYIGNCDDAVQIADKGIFDTHWETMEFYEIGKCLYSAGDFNQARDFLLKSLNSYTNFRLGFSLYRPYTIQLLGVIHEELGELDEALRYYEEILDLWQDADEDLLLLIETKERYAALKAQMGIS